jgi:pilus assembly protein CpaF
MSRAATIPPGLLERVHHRLASHGPPDSASVAAAVRAEAGALTTDHHLLQLVRLVENELIGAGPLAELLAEATVTDVVVNGPDDVRVDRGNGWEATGIRFADDAAVQRLARRLAATADRRLDEAQPFVDVQIAGPMAAHRAAVRLHAVLPPIASTGTSLSLRVLRPAADDMGSLDARGLFPPLVRDVLTSVVSASLAFLVSGGTGSGKTTLLAALLGLVDPADRIVTVEDAAELRPSHPHVVRLLTRGGNIEGAGQVSLTDLTRQALRMRPDRLVVGEVRGGEIADLLLALNTGHRGGAATVHANSADAVPARLVALASLAGIGERALHTQLGPAVQVLIHLRRAGGRRVVEEIAVLAPGPDGRVRVTPAYDEMGRCAKGADRLDALLAGA